MTREEYLHKIAKLNTSEKRKSKLIERLKKEYIEGCCALKVGSKYKTFRGHEIVKSIDVDIDGNFTFVIYNESMLYDINRTELKMNVDCIKTRKC